MQSTSRVVLVAYGPDAGIFTVWYRMSHRVSGTLARGHFRLCVIPSIFMLILRFGFIGSHRQGLLPYARGRSCN